MVVIFTGNNEIDKILEAEIKGSMVVSYTDFIIEDDKFKNQTVILASSAIETDFREFLYKIRSKNIRVILLLKKENKELIKNYEKMDCHELLENIYEQELFISNWDKADFLLENGTYIVNMPFINTEKIEKINWFYNENSNINRKCELITLEENKEKIKEILNKNCKIKIFDKNLLGGIIENKDNKQDVM